MQGETPDMCISRGMGDRGTQPLAGKSQVAIGFLRNTGTDYGPL